MDPNETLAEILANVRILLDEPSETPTAAQAAVADLLAERVRDLDEWIRKGGFLPNAWDARSAEDHVYKAMDALAADGQLDDLDELVAQAKQSWTP